MTLQEFLSTLATTNASVEIYDKASNTLIVTMLAGGYAALEDTLEAQTVDSWSITGSLKLKVVVTGE